jgi:hypothetical protein
MSQYWASVKVEGAISTEPNSNLPEFVKADCFNTAKSSPLFWRLDDTFGIVQAHTNFGFLAYPHKATEGPHPLMWAKF